jgi:hypothetical protein
VIAAGLDQSLLATQTSGFSGADRSNLVGGPDFFSRHKPA